MGIAVMIAAMRCPLCDRRHLELLSRVTLARHEAGGFIMPDKQTLQRARRDQREGKAPSTQAGEFVREEIEHIREGKHGARSTKQAIAIGLSKARRSGVKLPQPAGRTAKRVSASSRKPSPKRSRATRSALKREGHSAASPAALSRQAKSVARRRGGA
jgi:hypothetical protein